MNQVLQKIQEELISIIYKLDYSFTWGSLLYTFFLNEEHSNYEGNS